MRLIGGPRRRLLAKCRDGDDAARGAIAEGFGIRIAPVGEIELVDGIQIRTPAGTSISTFIREIEMINRGRERGSVSFSLPAPIAPDDVPEGSELWLERDGLEPVLEP